MARPVWRGHISFGLVNIPVNLHSAERRSDLRFHLLDSRDRSRVIYQRVSAETGEEVPWNTTVRGYEYSKGSYVVIDDKELKKAAPEATRTIEIEAFVDPREISVAYMDTPYYLEPGSHGQKGYVLLRETLRQAGLVGIAKVVIRTRQYLAQLLVDGDLMMLDLLRYKQELRGPDELDIPKGGVKASGISAEELRIAGLLVKNMTATWDPGKFHDEYRDALLSWIDRKVKSGHLQAAAGPAEDDEPEPPPPINFMELLRKSVEGKGVGGKNADASSASDEDHAPAAAGRSAQGAKRTRKPNTPGSAKRSSASGKPVSRTRQRKAG